MITEAGTVTEVSLTQTVPPALTYDSKTVALDEAVAAIIQKNFELEIAVGFYYRIQELSERACDILATDMHVDWYDYDWTLAEKRNAIETNVAIHRKMGTAYAVKRAISIITTGTSTVTEWYEYDGEPFRFRVTITEGTDPDNYTDLSKVLSAIQIYKPVRARLDMMTRELTIAQDITVHYDTMACLDSVDGMLVYDTEEPEAKSWVGSAIVGTSLVC